MSTPQLSNLTRYSLPAAGLVGGMIGGIVNDEDIGGTLLRSGLIGGLTGLGVGLAGKYMRPGIKGNAREILSGLAGIGMGAGGTLIADGVNSQLQQANVPGFRNAHQRNISKVNDYLDQMMKQKLASQMQPQGIVPEAYGSSNTYYA